jgi:glycosyltransferase involved in cell wall biosynthesis
MPRVSILLTCFNHIRFLPAAWDSVWAQSYRDFEVIAIDDGSTDGTREWLDQRAEPFKKIFNEQNLGTYASLNRALEEAGGEFVAVLNDDDLWAPDKLARQVELMDRVPDVGLAHTDGWFIDGEGRRMEGTPLGFEFPRFETGDVLLDLVYQNKIIASAALARMRCFRELGGFDPSFFGSGDWQMWFRIAERWKVGFVPEALTFYRVHGGNASHRLEKIWRDDEKLRDWMAERLEALERGRFPADRLNAAKAHNWASLGTVRTLNGDPAGGRRAYAQSLRLLPRRFKSRLRYIATYLPRPLFRKLL